MTQTVCVPSVDCESAAVHSYLNILQSVIGRMAGNSASCKSWCITLVTGIVVVLLDKDKGEFIYIAFVPTILFFFLDSYYLAVENGFRCTYNAFLQKLHEGKAVKSDLFIVAPGDISLCAIIRKMKTISILPFYVSIIAMLGVLMWHFGITIKIIVSL